MIRAEAFSREPVLREFEKVSAELGALARRTVQMQVPKEGDAVGVFLGLGERTRLESAVGLWNEGGYRYLLIAGTNPSERYHPTQDELLQEVYDLGATSLSNVRILSSALHTKEQADWLVQSLADIGASRSSLVEPDYHTPRVFATTLASLEKKGVKAKLWTASINYPMNHKTPEPIYPGNRQTPVFMASKDAERIVRYQDKGDVIDSESWIRALDDIEV